METNYDITVLLIPKHFKNNHLINFGKLVSHDKKAKNEFTTEIVIKERLCVAQKPHYKKVLLKSSGP